MTRKSQATQTTVAAFITFLLLSLAGVSAETDGVRQSQSLDGTWEIVFDPDNVGREGNWHRDDVFTARSDRRDIEVPSCWEEIEQDYEGVAFYRRKFQVPASWAGKTVRLQFDAVNYLTEVWLNDEVVGFHEGGFTPFEFRVDNLITPGQENTLILRVVGPIILQDKTNRWRGTAGDSAMARRHHGRDLAVGPIGRDRRELWSRMSSSSRRSPTTPPRFIWNWRTPARPASRSSWRRRFARRTIPTESWPSHVRRCR